MATKNLQVTFEVHSLMQDANDSHPPVLTFPEEDNMLTRGISFNGRSYIIIMPPQYVFACSADHVS